MSLNVQTSIAFGLGVGAGAIVDNPALDYDFVNFFNLADTVKAGPTLDFTRAGLGTHGDSAGLIQTALANVARFDHDKDGNALGLLIEREGENSTLHSEDFANAPIWFKSPTLLNEVDSNTAVAPDGTFTMDTLRDINLASVVSTRQDVPVPNDGLNRTFSLFILKDNDETRFPRIQLGYQLGTLRAGAYWINTKTGASVNQAGAPGSVKVEDHGLYWRMICTLDNNNSGNTKLVLVIEPAAGTVFGTFAAGATGEVTVWGAMLEEGPFATSYIKTTTAAVTRAADALSADVSGRDFTRGTLFFAGRSKTTFGVDVVGQLDDGTENNRIRIFRDFNNLIHAVITTGGVEQANLNLGTTANNARFKVVLTWTGPLATAVLDGGLVQAATVATIPPVNIWRGGSDTLGNGLNGHLEAAQVWDARQSNVFLQSITS